MMHEPTDEEPGLTPEQRAALDAAARLLMGKGGDTDDDPEGEELVAA